jgi:adenylosuccinate lyase
MFEPFKKKQVGSSTMPHKRNPHKSERICGIARVLKSNVIPALDNIVLEDERDITNSGVERVIFGENFILLDYIIKGLTSNLRGIEFDEGKIEENLNLTKGACLTEKVMVHLVDRGIGRQDGHELLRQAAITARNEDRYVKDIIYEHEKIRNLFSKEELAELFDPHKYIGKAVEQVESLVKFLKNKYNW